MNNSWNEKMAIHPAFSSFDRQCTFFIKGIAIILMVAHHMWGFKSVDDFSGGWQNVAPMLIGLGKAGKICVAIFAFISGFGLYLSYTRMMPERGGVC